MEEGTAQKECIDPYWLYSYYNDEGILFEVLGKTLLKHGVKFSNANAQHIYKRIVHDEGRTFKELQKLISSFITLFKSNGYDRTHFEVFIKETMTQKNQFSRERKIVFSDGSPCISLL